MVCILQLTFPPLFIKFILSQTQEINTDTIMLPKYKL